MKKVLCLVLALLVFAVPAMAEICQMPGVSFEIPAGYVAYDTGEDGTYGFLNASAGEFILGFYAPSDGLNLQDTAKIYANGLGIDENSVSITYSKGRPMAYLHGTIENMKMQCVMIVTSQYAYAISYTGENDLLFSNLMSSIKGEDFIGIGGYEIVSTQEYVRTPFRGLSYRVYTPDGRVDAETAMAIYDELFYKNQYDGYDLTSVWFYDMRSAAEEGGLIYGRIMQDDLSQEVEYEEMQ